MTNVHNNILYCGATKDLYNRVLEHKNEVYTSSFTSRYNVNKLVYFEIFSQVADAFTREKQIKAGSRKKKITLVEKMNPEWKDLFEVLKKDHQGEELNRLKNFLRRPSG